MLEGTPNPIYSRLSECFFFLVRGWGEGGGGVLV